ncbi:MAG: sulfotransferase domain-containing protein [Pseudomonadales bacterium]
MTTSGRPRGFDAYRERMQTLFAPEGVMRGLQMSVRPTDLFITPFAKCGTTWLQQMVHSLRTRGDLDFDDISRVVPWVETADALGIDLQAPQRGEPRAFKSHLSWHMIPKGGRYLLALRDPRDALVSMYRFMEGWFFEPGSVDVSEFARRQFMQRDDGMDYWSHLISWWQQRDNPSVLLLAYEHMKTDLPGTVRRVADFIGVVLDDELLATTLEQASLASMQAHKHKYDDLMMRELSERVSGLPPGSESSKVRKGEVGSHARELPGDVVRELDAIWTEAVTPETGFASYAALLDALR